MISSDAIGIFDSGVGGLNVLKLLENQFPNENFIYFADNANLPYGDKTQEEIIEFSENIVNFLISKKVKLIVVPCNTSSAISLEKIRKKVSIPIIDIITPITCEISKNFKKIALIATQGTVSSNAYLRELKKCNPEVELMQIPCPKLVPIIENNKTHEPETIDILKNYLKPIIYCGEIEALIYGCTHYQYLHDKIQDLLPKNIQILNPDDFICHLVKPYATNNKKNKKETQYYASGCKDQFFQTGKLFYTNMQIDKIKKPQYIKNPDLLKSKNFLESFLQNFSVLYFNQIDSTNNKAARLIKKKQLKKQTIIISESQTHGRGKGDSKWISSNQNISFTLLYKIEQQLKSFENFSLIVGLSLLETINDNKIKNQNLSIKIKYPNDILIDKKKVAGILIDVHRMNNENYIAIGIGINWGHAPLEISGKIEDIMQISKNEFIVKLVQNIDCKMKNPINLDFPNDKRSSELDRLQEHFHINLGQYSKKIMENLVMK